MAGSLLYFLQESMLFLPSTLKQDYVFQFEYPFEELFLKPDKNTQINAIHFKTEKPKGVILYFHGNAGDLSRWGTVAEYFVAMNYDVFIMDYRTYGKSFGELSEQAFYNDAQYCYNFLKEQYEEKDITVYGRSLGTAMATFVASGNGPKQLILETPYYSITDVAKSRFPIFPVERLLRYRFPSYQFVQSISCPILMFHGTDDAVIPFQSAKKLYDETPVTSTEFVIVEGGAHNNLMTFEIYQEAIKKILL